MFAALLMFFSTVASEFHTFYFLLKTILLYIPLPGYTV